MSEQKKKSVYKNVIEQISGLFLPILNCLTAASIIKSVMVILASTGVLDTNGALYMIFYAVSDGFFYFLPFFLAYTASKQWQTDPVISFLIPVAMQYPALANVLENGGTLPMGSLTVPSSIYHASVIPVLLAVGLLKFVEKPCDKFIHEAVRGFLKPIVCAVIVLPLTFLVFGSVGTIIGDVLTNIFCHIYDFNPILAGSFMGFFIQPMVVVGAHWSIVPVSIGSIATTGFDVIMPLLGGAVYGQAGAALAMGIIYKKNQTKRRAAFQAALSAALGVTEPALFSVNVATPRAMISACVAGAVGGAMTGYAGTHCTSFAFPSFVTAVAYVGPGFMMFLLSMVVSFILGFGFTIMQKKQILNK